LHKIPNYDINFIMNKSSLEKNLPTLEIIGAGVLVGGLCVCVGLAVHYNREALYSNSDAQYVESYIGLPAPELREYADEAAAQRNKMLISSGLLLSGAGVIIYRRFNEDDNNTQAIQH
jgi:hypothetical protein